MVRVVELKPFLIKLDLKAKEKHLINFLVQN